jgi:POT family proton-dependent oligopeptide transporter
LPVTAYSDIPAREDFLGHPKGVFVCFFTEMWERFSFYGMKALLLLYLLKHHGFSDDAGYDLIGAYGGLVYAVPVIGGLIADRWLGMRKAVVLGGVLLCLGHFGMAFEGTDAHLVNGVMVRDEGAMQVFYLSLALIIMGVGFLKPNISTIVGKLYADDDPRRDSGFTLFYAGINVGGLFAGLICAFLGETCGWKYGFGAAGIGMVAGLGMFLWGQKYLHGHAEPRDPTKLRERVGPLAREWWIYLGSLAGVAVVWQLIQRTWTVQGAMHLVALAFVLWFVWFLVRHCSKVERQQMVSLLVMILGVLVFLLRDAVVLPQTAGSLTYLGALFIVLLAPLFGVLWAWLDRRGLDPSKPAKSALGLLFAGLSFVPLAWAAQHAGATGAMASVWWLVLAYFVLEIGEMCLSPIGLSAVTQLSVARVVGLMMGGFWLATAYSELLAAQFGKLASLDIPEGGVIDMAGAAAKYGDLFQLLLWIGLGAALVFLLLAPLLRRWMHGVK